MIFSSFQRQNATEICEISLFKTWKKCRYTDGEAKNMMSQKYSESTEELRLEVIYI